MQLGVCLQESDLESLPAMNGVMQGKPVVRVTVLPASQCKRPPFPVAMMQMLDQSDKMATG